MQRDFGNLCKSDQMLLLGKNTPIYLQFVLATYFCQNTGHGQLSSLLGKKYCSMLEDQTTVCNVLKRITVSEFNHRVHFFSSTADLTILEEQLEAFKKLKFDATYIPFLCLMILYDTSQSTFSTSAEQKSGIKIEQCPEVFEDNLKGNLYDQCFVKNVELFMV